jgi:hypothetical protein
LWHLELALPRDDVLDLMTAYLEQSCRPPSFLGRISAVRI